MNKRTPTEIAFGVTAQELAVRMAEDARRHHHIVCSHDDWRISQSNQKPYRDSRSLFIAAIRVAYPDVNALDVYAVWVDCMESVEYCARYVRTHPDDIPTV
jgi:hypothetical protein